MKNKKKKKIVWQQYITMILFMIVGAVCGILMVECVDRSSGDQSLYQVFFTLIGLFIGMYAGLIIQIVIHEAGHLFFGLLSGYRFSSFRIFSFMWMKENGKIRLKRFSLAGTGGQCLMSPRDLVDGKIPVILYNLGGSLMNVITGFVFLFLFFVFDSIPILSTEMLMLAVIGFAYAIMNGIPMRMGTVDNDGYNAFALTRNSEAMFAFWVQLKANDLISKGMRLKDMPDEWFCVPTDKEMKNSMIAVRGVFACNRLLDARKFEEADRLMAHLLKIDSGIVGLHRNLLICDRIYVELITENRKEVLDEMLSKEQIKFMKQMKNLLSVLRTSYTYALLCEHDVKKAEQLKMQFEKRAKTYPYPNEVQSEWELMEHAGNVTENE
ncbi:MAG: hypothetical protein MSA09_00300 [Lachnospiraceae bacterium]|nr:hypothetical protein [Lachnospiraceae bacterium]